MYNTSLIFSRGDDGYSFLGKSFKNISVDLNNKYGIIGSLFHKNQFKIPQSELMLVGDALDLVKDGTLSVEQAMTSLVSTTSEASQSIFRTLSEAGKGSEALYVHTMRAGAGMKFLAAAGNMALSMLAMFAVQKVFQGLDYLANRSRYIAEELKNAADESRESFNKSSSETKSLDELIAKYEELASSGKKDASTREQIKGIQEEINGLVSSEAGSIDLVNGYLQTQLGILKEMRKEKAYEDEQKAFAAYRASKSASENTTLKNKHFFQSVYEYVGPNEDGVLEALWNAGFRGTDIVENVFGTIRVNTDFAKDAQSQIDILNIMIDALDNAGLKTTEAYAGFVNARSFFQDQINQVNADMRNAVETAISNSLDYDAALQSGVEGTAEAFKNYREQVVAAVSKNGFVKELLESGELTQDDLNTYATEVLATLPKISDAYNAWVKEQRQESILDAILGGDDFKKKSERFQEKTSAELKSYVASLSDEDLEIAFSVVLDSDSKIDTAKELQAAIEKAKKIPEGEKISFKDFYESNTISDKLDPLAKEYQDIQTALENLRKGETTPEALIAENPQWAKYADNMEAELVNAAEETKGKANARLEEIGEGIKPEGLKEFAEYSKDYMATNFASPDTLKFGINFDVESSGMDAVLDSIKSSVANLGLNVEQVTQLTARYKDLAGFAPDKLFEKTAFGIHLNTQELRDNETVYEHIKKQKMADELSSMTKEYKSLTDQIKKNNDANDTGDLEARRKELEQNIAKLTTMQSQYAALTNKYTKWQQAQSMGEEGDMYDNVTNGLENIKELYEDGLIGTNKFKSAIELMTGKDTVGMSSDDLIKAYDEAYPKMKKYFTEGQEGSEQFLKDVQKAGESVGEVWASQDEAGNWTFDIPIEQAAEQLGVSADLVEIMLRKLRDYNFDVDLSGFGDGIEKFATNTDDAVKSIQDSKEELKRQFESGEINTQEYVDAWEVLDKYEKKLKEIEESTSGEAPEVKPMTMEDALAEIQTLKDDIALLEGKGIELPVTITGEIDKVTALVDALGGNTGGEGSGGSVGLSFTIDTPEDAKSRIAEIKGAIEMAQESPIVSTSVTATLSRIGNLAIEQLESLANMTFPPNKRYEITIAANDEATPAIDEVEKNAETPITCTVTVTPVGLDVVKDEFVGLQGEHPANINVTDGGTAGETGKAIENAAEDQDTGIDVSDNGTADEVGQKIKNASADEDSSINVSDGGTATATGVQIDSAAENRDSTIAVSYQSVKQTLDNVLKDIASIAKDIIVKVSYQSDGEPGDAGSENEPPTGKQGVEANKEPIVGYTPNDRDIRRAALEAEQAYEDAIEKGFEDNSSDMMPPVPVSAEVANAEELTEDIEDSIDGEKVEVPAKLKPDDSALKDAASNESVVVPVNYDTLNTIGGSLEQIGWGALDAGADIEQVNLLRAAYDQLATAMANASAVDPSDTSGAAENAASELKSAAQNFMTQLDLLSQSAPDIELSADVSKAIAAVADIAYPESEVVFNPETQAVEAYVPADKSADVNFTADFSAVRSATVPTLHGVIEYTKKEVGGSLATGNAYAKGTAFSGGLKHDMTALAGEVGAETVVRDGKFFTIGDNGAEFFKFKSGDIIFNASQTKELFKTGRVRSGGGHGKVLGDGAAYAKGNAFYLADEIGRREGGGSTGSGSGSYSGGKGSSGKGKGSSGKGKGSSGKGNKKDSGSKESDVFDWIEVLINRIESAIKSLGRTAESTFKTLATRTSAINDEIKKVNSEIKTQQQAAQKYFDYANNVAKKSKLSDKLKEQIENGTIDITKYKGETLEAIEKYREWYEKGLAAQERAEELQEERSQLYQDRFEMIEAD